jgi:hypothetical protein
MAIREGRWRLPVLRGGEPRRRARLQRLRGDAGHHAERPVYRTRVSFDIDRWVHAHTERTSGRDQGPACPVVTAGTREREGARAESYVVLLQGERRYRYRVRDPARWASLRVGARVAAVIRGGSSVGEIR